MQINNNFTLFDRKEICRSVLMDIDMESVRLMVYLEQPDDGFFADVVMPAAVEIAGERRIVVGGLDWETPIGEDCFPVVTIPGNLINGSSLKKILRCEKPTNLATYLSNRNNDILFYFPVMERVTEPIQGLLRCLLDGQFASDGDPMDRKSTTHIILTASCKAVKNGGLPNVLDRGVIDRTGPVGLMSWASEIT